MTSPPPPLALTRVSTVCFVLRHVRIMRLHDILKLAHVSDTFRDALECYSKTVWRRLASSMTDASLNECFLFNACAWAANNLLTFGQLDVSRMQQEHPLRIAVDNGAVDVVRVCLAVIPGCVDVRDRDGWTALHFASYHGGTECARELLAAGADTASIDNSGWTALHCAARHGHTDIIRLLVANDDFENIRDKHNNHRETALHLASFGGHTECVREMLAAGAAITVVDNRHATPLHYAAEEGKVGAIRLFIAHANFEQIRDRRDNNLNTALHGASFRGHTECVRELLAAGADIAPTTNRGHTVLHGAAAEGKVDVVRVLVAHPDVAKIRNQRNVDGKTALDVARTAEMRRLLSASSGVGARCVLQ